MHTSLPRATKVVRSILRGHLSISQSHDAQLLQHYCSRGPDSDQGKSRQRTTRGLLGTVAGAAAALACRVVLDARTAIGSCCSPLAAATRLTGLVSQIRMMSATTLYGGSLQNRRARLMPAVGASMAAAVRQDREARDFVGPWRRATPWPTTQPSVAPKRTSLAQ